MNINVKRATIENINEIAEMFNAYRVFYHQESDLELATTFMSDRMNNEESIVFYAHNEVGEALGFTQLFTTFSSVSAKHSWILNDLFVASNSRRLGVGKKLMLAANDFAIETGANSIVLETDKDNYNAQALYESLGYEKEEGVYHYFLKL